MYDIAKGIQGIQDSFNTAKVGSLARLAYEQPQQRQSALAQMYGIDPNSANAMRKEFDEQDKEQLRVFATAFVNAPDAVKPQMYERAKTLWRPKFQALGSDVPDDWQEALPTIQALAGAGGQNTGVQSTFISDGKLNFLTRDGRTVDTGKLVDDSYQAIIDPVTGQVSGYARRGNRLDPTSTGGAPMASAPQGQDPMAGGLDFIAKEGERMRAAGRPIAEINAWKDQAFEQLRANTQRSVIEKDPQAGGQARVSVKPEAGITPYQQRSLQLQEEAAARAAAEAKTKADERKAAADAKTQERQARVMSAQQTTDTLLTNIQELKKHPGFKELGTFGGNAADAALPEWVPSDYRGAKGRLETIKGQIALQALSELKSLSASGASGFGALAIPELTLLQNSIQTLTTSQNNADILAAMEQIETLLTKAKNARQAPARPPAAPNTGTQRQVGKYIILED